MAMYVKYIAAKAIWPLFRKVNRTKGGTTETGKAYILPRLHVYLILRSKCHGDGFLDTLTPFARSRD